MTVGLGAAALGAATRVAFSILLVGCGGASQEMGPAFSTNWQNDNGRSIAKLEQRLATTKLPAGAAVAGSGIWATHFVAMLAFHQNLPAGYDINLTLLSIAIAIGIICPVIGLYASYWLNSATGATIVLVETAIFVVALLASRRPSSRRSRWRRERPG